MARGGQTDQAQPRTATESCTLWWSEAGAVAGSPCPGKAGLVQPDTHIFLLQGLPRGHKTTSVGPLSTLQYTHLASKLPPGALTSGQHPQRGVLT